MEMHTETRHEPFPRPTCVQNSHTQRMLTGNLEVHAPMLAWHASVDEVVEPQSPGNHALHCSGRTRMLHMRILVTSAKFDLFARFKQTDS